MITKRDLETISDIRPGDAWQPWTIVRKDGSVEQFNQGSQRYYEINAITFVAGLDNVDAWSPQPGVAIIEFDVVGIADADLALRACEAKLADYRIVSDDVRFRCRQSAE